MPLQALTALTCRYNDSYAMESQKIGWTKKTLLEVWLYTPTLLLWFRDKLPILKNTDCKIIFCLHTSCQVWSHCLFKLKEWLKLQSYESNRWYSASQQEGSGQDERECVCECNCGTCLHAWISCVLINTHRPVQLNKPPQKKDQLIVQTKILRQRSWHICSHF